jgi:hypothetical protein
MEVNPSPYKRGMATSSCLSQRGSCKKIDLVLFQVIPAPYQVRGKLQPESGVFKALRTEWTPVFTGVNLESMRVLIQDISRWVYRNAVHLYFVMKVGTC